MELAGRIAARGRCNRFSVNLRTPWCVSPRRPRQELTDVLPPALEFVHPSEPQPAGGSRRLAIEALEPPYAAELGGPRVIALTPTEVRNSAFDHVNVTFDGPIDGTTFTTQDVSMIGPAGTVTPSRASPLPGVTRIACHSPPSWIGDLRVTIGPDIADPAGRRMDQDGDGTGGKPTEDQYLASTIVIQANAFVTGTLTIGVGDNTYKDQDILVNGGTWYFGAATSSTRSSSSGAAARRTPDRRRYGRWAGPDPRRRVDRGRRYDHGGQAPNARDQALLERRADDPRGDGGTGSAAGARRLGQRHCRTRRAGST